jgi:hypothetical protein
MNDDEVGKKVKRKSYLIIALMVALTLSSGAYAYTYATASNTIAVAEPTGDIVAVAEADANDQPDWDDILPEGLYYSEYLLPCAPGDVTNIPLQVPIFGEHWDKVDDIPADDEITYVANWQHNQYRSDLYKLTDYIDAGGWEDINSVTVHFRVAGESGARARAIIKTNGTYFAGNDEIHPGGDYIDMSYQWTVNPATDEAWTWDEINELQAGISLEGVKQGGSTSCTQVYVLVDYEYVIIEGDVPDGELYEITPHPEYPGDLSVRVYLVNSGALIKAYQYINMKLSLEGDNEDFKLLSLDNGVATFNLEGYSDGTHLLSVIGGSYRLVSGDPDEWGDGWSITPEFYCEVTQR